jgi:protein subunit release factor B
MKSKKEIKITLWDKITLSNALTLDEKLKAKKDKIKIKEDNFKKNKNSKIEILKKEILEIEEIVKTLDNKEDSKKIFKLNKEISEKKEFITDYDLEKDKIKFMIKSMLFIGALAIVMVSMSLIYFYV